MPIKGRRHDRDQHVKDENLCEEHGSNEVDEHQFVFEPDPAGFTVAGALSLEDHGVYIAKQKHVLVEYTRTEQGRVICADLVDRFLSTLWQSKAIDLDHIEGALEHKHDGAEDGHEVADVFHCLKNQVHILG